MKLSMVSREERPIAHAKQLICEGYGRVWDMDYQKWIVDPRPRVLVFGSWTHPNTGNTLVGGVNLNYLNPEQIERLRTYLPEILAQKTLKARYWEGKRLLPDIFDNQEGYYRTYNRAEIRYIRPEVFKFMTPKELEQAGEPEKASQLATRRDVYKSLSAGRQVGEPRPSLPPDEIPPGTEPEEPKPPETPPDEPPAPPEEPKSPEEQEQDLEQDVKTTEKVAKDMEKSTGKKLLDRIDQRLGIRKGLKSMVGGIKSIFKGKPKETPRPEIPEAPEIKPEKTVTPEKTPEEKDVNTTKKVAKDIEKSTGKKLVDRIDQKLKSLFGGVKSLWKGKKKPEEQEE